MKKKIFLRDYQQKAYSFLKDTAFGKLILAMCPSSGKTETIIYYINECFKENNHIRVLILPHSTNVLFDNFYSRLQQRDVDFSFSGDCSSDVNVHVVLPQNQHKINGHYDLVIIDEAHENYLAKTVQDIIAEANPEKQILLTGTPSKFIGNKSFKMHFVALSDMDTEYLPKLRMDLIESYYDWNGHYNAENRELKHTFKFNEDDTKNSLKLLFDILKKRSTKKTIDKTLIVCKNIKQAEHVNHYLDFIGIYSAISHSENDKKSSVVNDFKNNVIKILIVVNRARLGYDDEDLINLIDMSGTLNPNIIYQMFARLLRGNNTMQKYYIRLTSKNDTLYNSEIATNLAFMLTHRKYIKDFNGKNFNNQEIMVKESFFNDSNEPKKAKKSKNQKNRLIIDSDDVLSFYKNVIDNYEKNVGIVKFCKIHEILTKLDKNLVIRRNYTFEECMESAKPFKYLSDWVQNCPNHYQYACKKGWNKDCSTHLIKKIHHFTFEDCMASASLFKDRGLWAKEYQKHYQKACRRGWLNECLAHMNPVVKHSLQSCKESASRFERKVDWQKNDNGSYKFAFRNGFLDECCAHMKIHFTPYTLEECIATAKLFTTKKEWREKHFNMTKFVQRRGWNDLCTAHMVTPMKHTIEECITDASLYINVTEWRKNNLRMYEYAWGKGWLNECFKAFKVENK